MKIKNRIPKRSNHTYINAHCLECKGTVHPVNNDGEGVDVCQSCGARYRHLKIENEFQATIHFVIEAFPVFTCHCGKEIEAFDRYKRSYKAGNAYIYTFSCNCGYITAIFMDHRFEITKEELLKTVTNGELDREKATQYMIKQVSRIKNNFERKMISRIERSWKNNNK